MRTALYRHYDVENTLLYVGISLSAINRLAQHRDNAHWFANIKTVKIEYFCTREAAEEAEERAILEEQPRHNVVHKINPRIYWRRHTATIKLPLISRPEVKTLTNLNDCTLAELINSKKFPTPVYFDRRPRGNRVNIYRKNLRWICYEVEEWRRRQATELMADSMLG